MATKKATKSKTAQPVSQATKYNNDKVVQDTVRVVVVLLLILIAAYPLLPAEINGVAWKPKADEFLVNWLGKPIPKLWDAANPMWIPLQNYCIYLLCLICAWILWGFADHFIGLCTQQSYTLKQRRTYLRLRVASDAPLNGAPDGASVLATLHGMLPVSRLRLGIGCHCVLRWSDLPNAPVVQGVTIAGDDRLVKTIEKSLDGLTGGSDAEPWDDPLLPQLQPGRYVVWAELRAALPDDLPFAIIGKGDSPLVNALVPAMAAQAGVHATDVQIMIRPVTGKWRIRVQARQESLRADSIAAERKNLETKASGPGYDIAVRCIAVADSVATGRRMVDMMVAAMSGANQATGTWVQKFVPGPISNMMVPMREPPPLPLLARIVILGIGLGVVLSGGYALGAIDATGDLPWLWLLPPLLAYAPALSVLTFWRWQTKVHAYARLQRVVQGVMPSRNPETIPLWHTWFGKQPCVLSVAEMATLWHPPSRDIGNRIQRLTSKWPTPPAKAFLPPDSKNAIVFGLGRKSDGTWKPVGFSYDNLRYVVHMTAPMGRGKSEMLKNIFDDIMAAGAPCFTFDFKGTALIKDCIPLVPLEREKDVVIVNIGKSLITGQDLRVSMNLLAPSLARNLGVDFSKMAATILQIFKALDPKFDQAVGIKQFANYGMLALLEGEPRATMMHLIRFFADEVYRLQVCSNVRTLQVKDFWERRFDEMPEGQKTSLAGFERRLDQMLTYPELASMLVAPGCSVDMRHMMDNNGILMAGIKATEGQIASLVSTLLLTQLTVAALSRDNIPEHQRKDVPVIIDEAQIPFGDNPDLANVIFSQLRSFHIGTLVVHQNEEQLRQCMAVLGGNAQTRVILGAEVIDAKKYGSNYSAQGLSAGDFVNMPLHEQLYVKLYGTSGGLFAARMLPMVEEKDHPVLPMVDHNWQEVRADAHNAYEQHIDQAIDRIYGLSEDNWDGAVETLGAMEPEQLEEFSARTKMHRMAQRQFILDNPGCIHAHEESDELERKRSMKNRRIRILSDLQAGIPRLETSALQWSILMSARGAVSEPKEKRNSKRSPGARTQVTAPIAVPGLAAPLPPIQPIPTLLAHSFAPAPVHANQNEDAAPVLTRLPTIHELMAERGKRRPAQDVVDGLDDLE